MADYWKNIIIWNSMFPIFLLRKIIIKLLIWFILILFFWNGLLGYKLKLNLPGGKFFKIMEFDIIIISI